MNNPNQSSQNTNTNDSSGGMTTFSDDGNYQSFWDIYNRNREMYYHYTNFTGDWGHTGILDFKITPYIGLAYYDTNNDGEFIDPIFGMAAPFNSLPVGTYPNLYDTTGNEIGNFIPARPFTITGAGIPTYWGTVQLEVFSVDHCHVIAANAQTTAKNPNGVYFDISTPPVPLVAATVDEEQLLSQYGKVFFYFWEAIDPTTLTVVRSGYIMADCKTNSDAAATYWADTGVTANLPGGVTGDLYYNIYSEDTMQPSHEIVLKEGTFPTEHTFSYTKGGQTYNYKVQLKTFLGGTNNPVSELKILDY